VVGVRRVGLVTIGQSPRVDVVPEMKVVLGDVEVVECGALDELSRDEIEALRPGEGEYLLVTRLRDGSEVRISRERVLPLVERCIRRLEAVTDVVGFLCTGDFPELTSSKILVKPSELLLKVVEALRVRKLGVLVPDPRQVPVVGRRWLRVSEDVVVESFSPYTGSLAALPEVVRRFQDRDLVVLDCIGYGLEVKRLVMELTGRPVVAPRTIMARVIRELLEVV
jgi:protein AroM